MFVDAHQRGFEVGTGGMTGTAWSARLRWIEVAPLKESEAGTIALYDRINIAHALHGGLVKGWQNLYHSGHVKLSWRSRWTILLLLCLGAGFPVKFLARPLACF